MKACAQGHVEAVSALLYAPGVDVNAHVDDRLGVTALMKACEEGHHPVVEVMLAADSVDVQAKDNDGWTALMWASHHRHVAVIQALILPAFEFTLPHGN